MKEIGIGLLGFGNVGAGVVEGLQRNAEVVAARAGVKLVLRQIADVDVTRDRGVKIDAGLLSKDAAAAIERSDVDVVVELIGGTGVAREFVKKALQLGKPVVTANKALLAKHGAELFALAAEKKTEIFFGASVGGGIPIIRSLREGLIANRIDSIYGILNGTCNYILTRMEANRQPFDLALAEAQAAGYAEADPALDIEGDDTAHKAVILASMAYGFHVPMDQIHVEGIRGLSEIDVQHARDLGYRIKLLAVVKREGEAVEVRVHPTMVPLDHVLASVSGVFNAVMVEGDMAGKTLYYGRGAGRSPTASTVIADLADAARNLVAKVARKFPVATQSGQGTLLPIGESVTRSYLRLSLLDKPGVLARITAVLGNHGISIASVLQKEVAAGEYVAVVIVTHRAREKEMVAALREIGGMDVVGNHTVRIRIED
jgi:homoserine dehydrogenase